MKNATPVAARVSFGSWEAGDLPRCKPAAVAEPGSHQVHGHCVCSVLRRAPKLPPSPGHRVSPTPQWGLRSYPSLPDHHGGTARKQKPCLDRLLLCMDLFRKGEENGKNDCMAPLQTKELEPMYISCKCAEIMHENIAKCFLYNNRRETDNFKVWFTCSCVSKISQMNQSLKIFICF